MRTRRSRNRSRREGAESALISRRVAALEAALGRRIVIRGARSPDPQVRGRIAERPGMVLVEYRDDVAGYFWHYDIIEELLEHLEQGRLSVVLHETGPACTRP